MCFCIHVCVCVCVRICLYATYVFESVHMAYLTQTTPMPMFLLSSTLAPLGTLEPQSFLFHNLLYISENWFFKFLEIDLYPDA